MPEYVIGDDARLRQVLVNLVSNAIKFTERGSVKLQLAAGLSGGGDPEITFRMEDTGIEAVSNRDYDVVLMDLQMPGMSGIEATRRIAEVTANKRAPYVVALTASVFDDDREACRQAGMRDFVGKPIEIGQLEAVLHRVAEERSVAGAPVIARVQLRRLRQIESRGDPGFVEGLVRMFLADAPKRLLRMEQALARRDAEGIEKEAHVLESSSATVGATEMSELCTEVEAAAREGHIELTRPKVAALSGQLGVVERALLREIASSPAQAVQEAS